MSRTPIRTFTPAQVAEQVAILIEIDAGHWPPPDFYDLTVISWHIACRNVSVAVTDRGKLRVRLTERGRTFLDRAKAFAI